MPSMWRAKPWRRRRRRSLFVYPELTFLNFPVQTLKRIRSIFLDQEFLRSRIPEKKTSFFS